MIDSYFYSSVFIVIYVLNSYLYSSKGFHRNMLYVYELCELLLFGANKLWLS
jgi:hypothetical protein